MKMLDKIPFVSIKDLETSLGQKIARWLNVYLIKLQLHNMIDRKQSVLVFLPKTNYDEFLKLEDAGKRFDIQNNSHTDLLVDGDREGIWKDVDGIRHTFYGADNEEQLAGMVLRSRNLVWRMSHDGIDGDMYRIVENPLYGKSIAEAEIILDLQGDSIPGWIA